MIFSGELPRNRVMYSTFLVGMALVVAAPAPKAIPKKEAPAILGEWSLEKAEIGGMVVPLGAMGEQLLTFAQDGTIIARKNGKEEPGGPSHFTHDPKKSPAEIDLTEARPAQRT